MREITFSARTRSHLVVAVELSSFKFSNLCCLQLLLSFLCFCHFLLIFVESLEVSSNDWDGQRENQDARHGTHTTNQLTKSWNIKVLKNYICVLQGRNYISSPHHLVVFFFRCVFRVFFFTVFSRILPCMALYLSGFP